MLKLNFSDFNFRVKNSQNKLFIFDSIRKKFVSLQPEEWVRQHVIQFLIQEKHYPKSIINVEKELRIGSLSKRYDVVVFNPDGSIHLLIECKAPNIAITQKTFNQIAQYNLTLNATYLMVTNGINHYFCRINYEKKQYDFLKPYLIINLKFENSLSHIKLERCRVIKNLFAICNNTLPRGYSVFSR